MRSVLTSVSSVNPLLAQASKRRLTSIGCTLGQCAVVDARLDDVESYAAFAASKNMRVTHVIDTRDRRCGASVVARILVKTRALRKGKLKRSRDGAVGGSRAQLLSIRCRSFQSQRPSAFKKSGAFSWEDWSIERPPCYTG
jgi:hypothetical protein